MILYRILGIAGIVAGLVVWVIYQLMAALGLLDCEDVA
jgi:hypothetical protein